MASPLWHKLRDKELQSLFEIDINEKLFTIDPVVIMVHDALNTNFITLVVFHDVDTSKMSIFI